MRCHRYALAMLALVACNEGAPCETESRPSRDAIRCEAEFSAQAARPMDASLPGARTVKTIVDRASGDTVHFMDTMTYPMHSTFAVEHLDYPRGAPFFREYFDPGRRLLLGAVTHYEEPDVWAYELAPYDTAALEMITAAFTRIAGSAFFGDRLRFHPTSEEQAARAAELSAAVPVVTTDEIYAGLSYQPLNLGETYARVRLLSADDLAHDFVSPREIAVLDRAPNDISVVAGVVTEQFQTLLSHVNVLSRQRGTPNMALRGARDVFGPIDGRWVRLVVSAFEFEVAEVTRGEAEEWFERHRPLPSTIPPPDYSVTGILDVDDVGLDDIPAVGGKAAHYGELRRIGGDVRVRDALVIPVHHYRRFLEDNGFDAEIDAMLADPEFLGDGNVRRQRLADLGSRMRAAPIDAVFVGELEARLRAEFPATRMKFRSSTNAEDLERHTGAGLYESRAGEVDDPAAPVAAAVRAVWASVWSFRAFEERSWAGIREADVAMAVLVNPSYRDEAANGVAITANIYDPAPGGEDAFFVNAQVGEVSVVEPDPSVVADQLMYFFFHNGQPATYYTRTTLLPPGSTVLSRAELHDLGRGLAAVREHFAGSYDPPEGYARLPMDVEWKLVPEGGERRIWIKQARPFPGR